ncbi:hypothetical protein L596_018592 [Steinernema carpocapsae]|uniref:Uncharacterized protein n=1 Tax=Steinernema carpocapsae TaxID=34508 RepID=A0A4V6XW47_STECR|nr:hypothetical protein L596_018592 [Steinernema carpocapsae]
MYSTRKHYKHGSNSLLFVFLGRRNSDGDVAFSFNGGGFPGAGGDGEVSLGVHGALDGVKVDVLGETDLLDEEAFDGARFRFRGVLCLDDKIVTNDVHLEFFRLESRSRESDREDAVFESHLGGFSAGRVAEEGSEGSRRRWRRTEPNPGKKASESRRAILRSWFGLG